MRKIFLREKSLFLIFSVFIAITFSSCSNEPRDAKISKGEAKILLRVAYWGVPEEAKINEKILMSFERKHPNISVRKEVIPVRGYHEKLLVEIMGGVAPDIMLINDKLLPEFAQKGVLLNLKPYIQRDDYSLDDFFVSYLQDSTYRGELYGLPEGGGAVVIFYNKDLFDQAGVSYPHGDWTWDTFLEKAQKLTKDINGDGRIDQFGVFPGVFWAHLLPWIWEAGGDLLNEDMTECKLNSPEAIKGIQFFFDLIHKYKVAPGTVQLGAASGPLLFEMGRVAMYVGGPWDVPQFKQKKNLNWDVYFYPRGKAGRFTRSSSNCYTIWSGTKHPDEAWQLLKFLVGQQAVKIRAESGEAVPPRKSIAYSKVFLRSDTPWHEEIFVEAMDYARPMRIFPGWAKMSGIMAKGFQLMYLGKVTVKEEIRILDSDINAFLKENNS